MPPEAANNLETTAEGDAEAIAHLKETIIDGSHWYLALLEAIKLWQSPEEDYEGRHYRYLIDGEAFDWLLLAERICDEVRNMVPEEEIIDLLFFDRPPLELTREQFKKSIGAAKYQAYLNYLYGVLVEEALIAATLDDVRKERRTLGMNKYADELDKAYRWIYSASQAKLLTSFRQEKHYPQLKSTSLSERKEFTYWLFKRRLKMSDKTRVASDTKRALSQMQRAIAAKKSPLL
jgi:hypothetical protein